MRSGPAFTVAASGIVVAPGIGATLLDTGNLAAGDYEYFVYIGTQDTAVKDVVFQHRNAADSASIWEHCMASYQTQASHRLHVPRETIAANESLKVIMGTIAGAGGTRWSATIFYRRVA